MNGSPRIAVIGSGQPAGQVREALVAAGLDCARVGSPSQLDGARPGVVVVLDSESIAAARETLGDDAAILAWVEQGGAEKALATGATDVVLATAPSAALVARVKNLWSAREADELGRDLAEVHEALVAVQSLLAHGGDSPDALRSALMVARDVMGYQRASLVANIEASERAYVIAATDDPLLQQFSLGIWDYPEIREAVHNAEPVVIDDALQHPVTTEVAAKLRDTGVRAILVVPVLWQGRALGAAVFRNNVPGPSEISPTRLSFAQLFATSVAAHLRDSTVIRSLRDQTHNISRASYEAERRSRTVESLKEHFEAAADGVLVISEDGAIIFVNGVAETITGFARDALTGASLFELILDDEHQALSRAIACVLGGDNLEAFDLHLSTTSGHPVCVSVTTSTVLAKSGAAILSFREVTQERMLETELRKTKEFLEKMIDSTVDGIVAADTRGSVILFNAGAERIFGYTASEVVSKLPVWRLYPEGVPRQIMSMLRSEEHGGVGRLQETRREILNKSGEMVPVTMTASIIFEDDREVATVGMFSDLRERIRIEQRLVKAQEELELSEKRALVAQLAGTAAHELNQPLTSIMGYAQLVSRQLEGEAAGARAVDIILREAERMAEIVRKIGRITQFETKEYVGSASIIDLDKSAPSPPEFGKAVGDSVPESVRGEDTKPHPVAAADDSSETEKRSPPKRKADDAVSAQKRTVKIPRLDKDGNPVG